MPFETQPLSVIELRIKQMVEAAPLPAPGKLEESDSNKNLLLLAARQYPNEPHF